MEEKGLGLPIEDSSVAWGLARGRQPEERLERRHHRWWGRLPEHMAGRARAGEVEEEASQVAGTITRAHG